MDDLAALRLLEAVTDEWAATGVLGVLCDLVDQVWRTDLDRYEPELGDDAMSLGMQASRNLCNLSARRLQGVRGVSASNGKTLEVRYRHRVLHVGKAPSDSPSWSVDQVDWADSEVREHAAAANTAAYQSSSGTLFEGWDALPGQSDDPSALRHLHLTWQGLADGRTRTWLGFPQLGRRPWYAVLPLDPARVRGVALDVTAAVPAESPLVTLDLPDFDTLGEPDVPVTRRPDAHRRPRQQEA